MLVYQEIYCWSTNVVLYSTCEGTGYLINSTQGSKKFFIIGLSTLAEIIIVVYGDEETTE